MKKLLALIMILVCALCLIGCGNRYNGPLSCISRTGADGTVVLMDMTEDVHKEILLILNNGTWENDVCQCVSDFTFEIQGDKIKYSSECGTCNDVTNKRHMTLSDSERTKINQLLGVEPSVVKTYEETDREQFDVEEFFIIVKHYEMSDGTWKTDKHTYQYRLELTGRINNAASDSTFVYLSNVEDISFDKAWKAAGLSSNRDDYFDAAVAILVAMK